MKIIINYESKWSASFADHDTKECKAKSLTSIQESHKDVKPIIYADDSYEQIMHKASEKFFNYTYKPIEKNTVLGILSRLLGEVRYLSTVIEEKDHILNRLKDKVSFAIINQDFYNEIVTIKTPINDAPSGGCGMIGIDNDSIFLNKNIYSQSLMTLLSLEKVNDILEFSEIMINKCSVEYMQAYLDKITSNNHEYSIISLLGNFNKFQKRFEKIELRFNKQIKEDIPLDDETSIYKLILENLGLIHEKNDKNLYLKKKGRIIAGLFMQSIAYWLITIGLEKSLGTLLNKNKNISGIASDSADKPGFLTEKDFYTNFGKKRKTTSSPYFADIQYFKKEGENNRINTKTKLGMGKEDGVLEIIIDVSKEEAINLKSQIEDAGVSVFQMGKKGLAYIKRIEI